MTDKSNTPKSFHIFTFPFKWDIKPKEKSLEETDFTTRASLETFDELLKGSDWKETFFKINTASDYNEYIYFYDFARDAIYPVEKNTGTLRQYEYNIAPGSKPLYKIKTIDLTGGPITYELEIEKILLTVYFTGVGILSYHLENTKYSELKDILRINEFGRRIYPQFLSSVVDGLTGSVKNAFLADSLEVVFSDTKRFESGFQRFDKIDKVRTKPDMLSHTIMGILGKSFYTGESEKENEGIRISPILDDRMFVLCWLADKTLCETLAKYDKKIEMYGYMENDDWYKLVFIDKSSPSCNSIPMKKRLLMEHTYDRWIGTKYSSLFGIARYSFVMLNDDEETFVKDHLKTMYFRMVLLALAQRASILRFSAEATRISDLKEHEETTEKVSELQKKYLQFINKIYFREITAFEQGIDLYERVVRSMEIERDVKALDQEIEELRNYASLKEENRKNNLLQKITVIGTLFLIPSLLISYLGINMIDNNLCTPHPYKALFAALVIIVLPIATWFSIRKRIGIKPDKKNSITPVIVIVIIVLIIMILFPIVSSFITQGE